MDEAEFEKNIKGNIVRLFPDAADVPGKRVLIKLNSGPGELNIELLAFLRSSGFYLYPCVPNTTHVTQETDISYGVFKSKFRSNLQKLTAQRLANNMSISFPPSIIGLLVLGGTDERTGIVLEDAFAEAFSYD